MSAPKSLTSLEKTKEAVLEINRCLRPVLDRLKEDDTFGVDDAATSGEAQATVALSVGMMRYMGARLRGLDQGRKQDDSLRRELNNMKRVLSEIKRHKPKPTGRQSGTTKASKGPTRKNATEIEGAKSLMNQNQTDQTDSSKEQAVGGILPSPTQVAETSSKDVPHRSKRSGGVASSESTKRKAKKARK